MKVWDFSLVTAVYIQYSVYTVLYRSCTLVGLGKVLWTSKTSGMCRIGARILVGISRIGARM